MSRYYIYDAQTDSIAEFSNRYKREMAKLGWEVPGSAAGEMVAARQARLDNALPASQRRAKQARKAQQSAITAKAASNRARYAIKTGAVGSPTQRTLRNNLLGTSLAGRGLRAAGVLGTVGAVGLGGMALKRRADRKAAERNSIKGRVKSLLGR